MKDMNIALNDFKMRRVALGPPKARPLAQRQQIWDWRTFGAIFGLSAGIISVTIGSLMTVVSWFQSPVGNSYAKIIGTVLLLLTIPLLILGAHCLDLAKKQADKTKKSRLN